MGGLKTFLVATLGLTCGFQAGPVRAEPLADTTTLFATCTGRLSALREYQWQHDGPASDATSAQMRDMADLLDAVTPAGDEARVMQIRLEAKVAQAALLQHAPTRADALVAHCRQLLLGT